MWEEGALPAAERRIVSEEKKFFGKIIDRRCELPGKKALVCTVELKEDLFRNENFREKVIKELTTILREYFDKYGIRKTSSVLVAGLGNDKVTADSLGSAVCDKLFVTSHIRSQKDIFGRFGNLSALKCGVSGTTGIESFDIISAVTERISPDIILAIDTLSGNSLSRVARTVQLTDGGIEPGGGVANAKRILDRRSLGRPIVAIGVPLVFYVRKILAEFAGQFDGKISDEVGDLVVTAKEIDFQIDDFSVVIAESINRTVHQTAE